MRKPTRCPLGEPADAHREGVVIAQAAFDGADGVNDGGVVAAANGLPYGFEGEGGCDP